MPTAFKKFWVKLKRSRSKSNLTEGLEKDDKHASAPASSSNLHERVVKTDSSDDDTSLITSDARKEMSTGSFGFNIEHLEKDDFPEFDDVPEEDYDSESLDEEEKKNDLGYQMMAQKYETKEDQDVAVFLALADRMSISSLLHILQNHVRENNIDVQKYAEMAKQQPPTKPEENKPLPRPKKTRFAEVSEGKVRATVMEVENLKTMKGLWWKPAEMRSIQEELVETVQFFRRYRHDYIESVEVIAQKSDKLPEEVVEKHLKNLTKDNYTRGLEAHIVRLLSENRKTTVRAVMQQQKAHKDDSDEEEKLKILRRESLANSKLSTRFAEKMGQCDEIIALKASLSAW